MRRSLFAGLSVLILGCGSHSPKDLAGIWKSSKESDFVFDGSKNFRVTVHRGAKDVPETGVLSMAGDEVNFTITSANGRSTADLKAVLEGRMSTLPPRLQTIAKALDQPETFRLKWGWKDPDEGKVENDLLSDEAVAAQPLQVTLSRHGPRSPSGHSTFG